MAAVQKPDDRGSSQPNLLEGAPNTKIPARRHQPLFKSIDCVRRSSRLLVNVRQVQVQLGVVAPHSQCLPAESLCVAKPSFRERSQQPRIGKIKRVFWSNTEGAPGVLKGFFRTPITQILQTLLKVRHPSIGGRCGSYPVRHRLLSSHRQRPIGACGRVEEAYRLDSSEGIGRAASFGARTLPVRNDRPCGGGVPPARFFEAIAGTD